MVETGPPKKGSGGSELFSSSRIFGDPEVDRGRNAIQGHVLMRDKKTMTDLGMIGRTQDDALGANSDIGRKLRALYGAVQSEEIPTKLLDLLEKLDAVEKRAKSGEAK
jgi:hypothetical protein